MSNYLIPIAELTEYYDPNDVTSVTNYAKQLLHTTLRLHLNQEQAEYSVSREGKGDFGNILEEGYFKIRNNNDKRPDILECGIEIKSGQVKVVRKTQDVLKERLKISMIDYMNGFEADSLKTSLLWPKLEKILLLLFRQDKNLARIDEECVFSGILSWSQDDIKQMSEDWLHIKHMVSSGKANEISEGQTWYLGACTAGSDSSSMRMAPGGAAKVRAYTLKQSYLNFKLGYSNTVRGPKIILTPSPNQTLDEYILTNMRPYFDKPIDKIAVAIGRSGLSESLAKNMRSKVARALLEEITGNYTQDISTDFEQFRKAGVIEKTVALEMDGRLVQAVSFPTFKWLDLNQESEWEDSELYNLLTRKFFFTVFKKLTNSMPIFIGCFFWAMPDDELQVMKELWLDTKKKIKEGKYDDFIKISDRKLGHVRPHGRKAIDTYPTPQGGKQTKSCFWLNAEYIKKIIKKELDV